MDPLLPQLNLLPPRRSDLVIRPLGEAGRHVVKDPLRGDYFELGAEEHFLLLQLDGRRSAEEIAMAFEERFGQSLSAEELEEFLALADERGLVQTDEPSGLDLPDTRRLTPDPPPGKPQARKRGKQSILYWRKRLFNPDRLFSWLEPKICFFWTRGFLVSSATPILLAALVLWTNRYALPGSFQSALRWETALLVWITLLGVTTLHEFGHGLTCKHYGGEVREIGFLLMFFMPCFYCNVSDAWLFKEKSKRLWVMLAGGYVELLLWALAVFVWRLTVPDSLINYLAFVVLSVCGVQSFFNFNPLLKLDGYYLLSDWVEIPNLRQRALEHFKAHLRWLLWGACRPEGQVWGRFLLGFGLASWFYALVFLSLMLVVMGQFLGARWGPVGFGAVAVLGVMTVPGLFKGLSSGEAKQMILKRHMRTLAWLLTLGSAASMLVGFEVEDRAAGPFEIRSALRTEVRAPVAAFVAEVFYDEGDRVSPGAPLVRLEIPDLASRLARKRAELNEAQAQLRLLEVGPRPEELTEQRQRIERAQAWCDLARQDLTRTQQALSEDLARLDQQVAQYQAERDAARDAYQGGEALRTRAALSDEEYREAEKRLRVSEALLEQARAQKRSRQATGTLEAEAELARREKELAVERAALTLLELGNRPEEIDAQRAALCRFQEELKYLETLEAKLLVYSPGPGLVTTPYLAEKVGRYLQEGETICLVEEPSALEAEIALSEQQVNRIRVGQSIRLKARALPFEMFLSQVERIAPVAEKKAAESPPAKPEAISKTVTVYCRLENGRARLQPGMTGYARIYTGPAPLGQIVLDRVLRYVRTEFWW